LKEDPEERRKEMSGRKYALWAVAISAVLVTAGLILSCGDDDDNGAIAVNCKDTCEKLEECEWIPGYIGEDVEECEEACEAELGGAKEGLLKALQCIPDTDDCDDIWANCFCQAACEKIKDCHLLGETMADCVYNFDEYYHPLDVICVLELSSCRFIYSFCWD
jgi:hypothetical protein